MCKVRQHRVPNEIPSCHRPYAVRNWKLGENNILHWYPKQPATPNGLAPPLLERITGPLEALPAKHTGAHIKHRDIQERDVNKVIHRRAQQPECARCESAPQQSLCHPGVRAVQPSAEPPDVEPGEAREGQRAAPVEVMRRGR